MKETDKMCQSMKVTIRDVANEAGVSLTTVSHALNGYADVSEKTRKKIFDIAKRLDYIPDEDGRALRGIQKKNIAFVLTGNMPTADPSGFTFGLMSGIYTVAQEKEYDFEIITVPVRNQNKVTFNQVCRRKKLTGVVVYGLAKDMPYYEQIRESKIPCILVDVKMEGLHVREISVDNEKASFEEVEHLIQNGFRNIAMLSGKKVAQVSELRENGYRRALKYYGFPIIEKWIVDCDFDKDISMQKAMELKHLYPEIDAFFCASDSIAIGAVEGMRQFGVRVPMDVAVAGFDDYTITKYIYGGITSVKQYPYQMGVKCAQAVADMVEGKDVPKWIQMEYTLQKRLSTKRVEW